MGAFPAISDDTIKTAFLFGIALLAYLTSKAPVKGRAERKRKRKIVADEFAKKDQTEEGLVRVIEQDAKQLAWFAGEVQRLRDEATARRAAHAAELAARDATIAGLDRALSMWRSIAVSEIEAEADKDGPHPPLRPPEN